MRSLSVLAAMAVLIVVGCDSHLPPEHPAPSMPAVANGSAEEAARSWLLLSQTLLRAREHHDARTAATASEQLHRLLILPDRVKESASKGDVLSRVEDMTIDNWCAGIAYYTDRFDFGKLRIEPPVVANGPTGVLVPASGTSDNAVIGVTCKWSEQGWRVGAINLLPESAIDGLPASGAGQPTASAPAPSGTAASAPASQP